MGVDDKGCQAVRETIAQVASDVYVDIGRPAAREVGSALETIFKIGLSPVSMLDWGFEKTKDWLIMKIETRLDKTPRDCVRSPPLEIAIPAISSISMSVDSPDLRELYAEILLKAMDSRTESSVHPSYINIIGQLSSQEALVFVNFSKMDKLTLFEENDAEYSYAHDVTVEGQFEKYCLALGLKADANMKLWLENLQRLKLVDLREYTEANYVEADSDQPYPSVKNNITRFLELTEYGRAFLEACSPPDAVNEY